MKTSTMVTNQKHCSKTIYNIIFIVTLIFITHQSFGQTIMDTSINYIHQAPESFKAKAVRSFLAMIRANKILERMMTKDKINQKAASIPRKLRKENLIVVTEKSGRKIWTITPKHTTSNKTILFIHGGAYVLNISSFQWQFVEALIEKTNCTIVIPDYPLAPSATYKEAYDFVQHVYDELVKQHTSKNLILMGDSAGGGFIAGFSQKQRNDNKPLPAQVIMLSPWLDISMNNPEISKSVKYDKMLNINGTQLAGRAYAGNLDVKNYLVSPIYGDFSGIENISIFTSTYDLLYADCKKFKDMMQAANIPINYFEYPKMIHGWMIVSGLKESKSAVTQIAKLINQ